MVSFVCDGCQDTVTKPKVKAHKQRCRQSFIMICVDCSKTFRGAEVETHSSCITEEQAYYGKFAKQPGQKQQQNQKQHQAAPIAAAAAAPVSVPVSVPVSAPAAAPSAAPATASNAKKRSAEEFNGGGKKAKVADSPEVDVAEESSIATLVPSFQWKKQIVSALKKSGDVSESELREKVVNAFLEAARAEAERHFASKLASSTKCVVVGDRVTLKQSKSS